MDKKNDSEYIPGPLLTTGEVARYCHVSVMQVNRWIKNGTLKAFRNPGGRHRVSKDDFRAFLEYNRMPVVKEFFDDDRNRKILIVDDDRDLVKGIRHLIESNYVEVDIEVAYDGYEALLKAGDFKPDLLILDIMMPKIDGLAVCRRIRENAGINPDIRILAITGHSEAYDREIVLDAGADEFMLKPIDSDGMLAFIEKLI